MRCATEAEATGAGDSGILSEWIGGVGQMTVLGTRLPIDDVRASSATEVSGKYLLSLSLTGFGTHSRRAFPRCAMVLVHKRPTRNPTHSLYRGRHSWTPLIVVFELRTCKRTGQIIVYVCRARAPPGGHSFGAQEFAPDDLRPALRKSKRHHDDQLRRDTTRVYGGRPGDQWRSSRKTTHSRRHFAGSSAERRSSRDGMAELRRRQGQLKVFAD